MEPEEQYYKASNLETPVNLEQHLQALHQDLTLRDAEIKALRETVDLLYNHLAQWDRQLHQRLQGLQEQVAALEAERASAKHDSVPASTSKGPVAYRDLIRHIRHVVHEALPAEATVLVISRGDGELLRLKGRHGWHFPQQEDGVYAGYYPANSAAAISHLEQLRSLGAGYLLIPQTALWWLDYYTEFARHLRSHYEVIVRQDDTCWIIDLNQGRQADTRQRIASSPEEKGYRALKEQIHDLVSVLLPSDATVLVVSKGDDELVRLCGDDAQHFPQESEGGYAGYYPASSEEAIAHLENLRQQGGDFLLFPSTAFWWLDYYRAFREHLEDRYPVVCRQQHLCLIFALKSRRPLDAPSRIER